LAEAATGSVVRSAGLSRPLDDLSGGLSPAEAREERVIDDLAAVGGVRLVPMGRVTAHRKPEAARARCGNQHGVPSCGVWQEAELAKEGELVDDIPVFA
jgi:hypothetical protein